MRLIDALRYSGGTHMAFVGAGGKTTALFRVARELLPTKPETSRKSVLVTTTTHFGTWQAQLADQVVRITSRSDLGKLEKVMPEGIVLLAGEESNDRLSGLSPVLLDYVRLMAEEQELPILIEADGAHTLALKAPDLHEPSIPEFVQHVILVAGLSALGKPLSDNWVHRPRIFSDLSGLTLGETITCQSIINVVRNKQGGLKNIPSAARKTVLLNQADTAELQSRAREISAQLIPDFDSVVIASLSKDNQLSEPNIERGIDDQGGIHAVIEQLAGIILAAGGSSRFGQPKQLLPWRGQPLIRHVILAALKAGLSPLVVVLGASAQVIKRVISDLPVRIVNNDRWMNGLSSSIKAGIRDLPEVVGGAIFFQADQPQVSPILIKAMIESHQNALAPIVAPQINGQRGNPVLFDVRTFTDLLSVKGDMGGRGLFSKLPVLWVAWDDPKLLQDIDSPEDYLHFLEMYPDDEVNL